MGRNGARTERHADTGSVCSHVDFDGQRRVVEMQEPKIVLATKGFLFIKGWILVTVKYLPESMASHQVPVSCRYARMSRICSDLGIGSSMSKYAGATKLLSSSRPPEIDVLTEGRYPLLIHTSPRLWESRVRVGGSVVAATSSHVAPSSNTSD